jgi:AraC family transcriptional regulator of adaptative response / DNA-3-methyladenine glycosylase II
METMNDDTCYRALLARDTRFDGLFFVAVLSTGIYCRPICPARPPRRDRCRFYASSAIAERAGFRPCLRCRPELAPGQAPVDSTSATARRAAARIGAGALNDGGSLESLAEELGLSSRQLRRTVRKEFGVSPVQLAQTGRLLLAKQLLTETNLPVVRVAFASGFESLRRFNDLFRRRYGLTPSRIRKRRSTASGRRGLAELDAATEPEARASALSFSLSLSYRPPFAWPSLLRFLGRRATPGVEMVAGGEYRRTVGLGNHRGWLAVAQGTRANTLRVELSLSLVPVLPAVLSRLRHLLDLDARPDLIAEHLADDPHLGPLVAREPGLRVTGAFDGFEVALRVVLGQRISVAAASTLAGRLAARFGEIVETPYPGLDRLAPSPESIAAADPTELRLLGIPAPRVAAIQAIAAEVASGFLELEPGLDPDPTIKKLRDLTGVGDWTAHVIAMRALRWPDAFPANDLGLKRAWQVLTAQTGAPLSIQQAAAVWRPWRSYAAGWLWNSLRNPDLNPSKPEDQTCHEVTT